MAELEPLHLGLVVMSCMAFALATLWLAARMPGGRSGHHLPDGEDDDDLPGAPSYLFLAGRLVDATPAGWDLLSDTDPSDPDWARVHAVLRTRFPDVPRVYPTEMDETLDAMGDADLAQLRIVARDDIARVTLSSDHPPSAADEHRMQCARIDIQMLRLAVDLAPFPAWTCDADEKITWCNAAYRDMARDPARFRTLPDRPVLSTGLPLPEDEYPVAARVRHDSDGPGSANPTWYDVTIRRSGDEWIHYATDITPVVRAEIAQRNFVQTLTKTFAQLSTGLAIFDRNRQLALFNPALIDLTMMTTDFLSGRPGLSAFFDDLRDRQVMPEPKSYASWRDKVSELVNRATNDRFHETWTLSTGRTYRVTGRPHPDGAIAFLFEDISAEITLTRGFRHQIETMQAVVESLDEAVAIFTPTGNLSFANAAYRALWNIDPQAALDGTTATEATRQWQTLCAATPVWGELRDFVSAYGPRSEWFATVMRKTGAPLDCRFAPLPGGATLAGFRPAPADAMRKLVTAG